MIRIHSEPNELKMQYRGSYPFKTMEVGHWFDVPANKGKSIASMISNMKKRGYPGKFITRAFDAGMSTDVEGAGRRVERVE